ncbi:MAG: hypothetical protein A2284_10720 [Deltaproteobacteria bacterium RIFOXYA12_FULL_61_11]|nr:MAG: hypothetical protein A2284_10720 [Deltaproteobacteria bacterium RIFOXYA12_FULL_61_11]
MNVEAVHDGANKTVRVVFEGLSADADLSKTSLLFKKTLYQTELDQAATDGTDVSYTVNDDDERVLTVYKGDYGAGTHSTGSSTLNDGFLQPNDFFLLFLSGFSHAAFNDEDLEQIEAYLDAQFDMEGAFTVSTEDAGGGLTAVLYTAKKKISVDGWGDKLDEGVLIDPLPEGLLTDADGNPNLGGFLYLLEDSQDWIDAEPYTCKVTVNDAGAVPDREDGTLADNSTITFNFFDEDDTPVLMDGHGLAAAMEAKLQLAPFTYAEEDIEDTLLRTDATSITVTVDGELELHANQKTATAGKTVTFEAYTLSSASGLGNRKAVSCLIADVTVPTYTVSATCTIDEDNRVEENCNIVVTFSETMENTAGEVADRINDVLETASGCTNFNVAPPTGNAAVFTATVPATCNQDGVTTPVNFALANQATVTDVNLIKVAQDQTLTYDPPTAPRYEIRVITTVTLDEDYTAKPTDTLQFGFDENMENADAEIRKAIVAAIKASPAVTGTAKNALTEGDVTVGACPADGGTNYGIWLTDDADVSPDVAFHSVQCWNLVLPAATDLVTSAAGIRITLEAQTDAMDDHEIDLARAHSKPLVYDPPKPPTFTVTATQGTEGTEGSDPADENVWCDGQLQEGDRIVFTFSEPMENGAKEVALAIVAWFNGADANGSGNVATTDVNPETGNAAVFTLTLPEGSYIDTNAEKNVNLGGGLKDLNDMVLSPSSATLTKYDVLEAALAITNNYIAKDDLFIEEDKMVITFTPSGFAPHTCEMNDFITLGAVQKAVDTLMGAEVAMVESNGDGAGENTPDNVYTITILPNREFAPKPEGSTLAITGAQIEYAKRFIAGDVVKANFNLEIEDASTRRTAAFSAKDTTAPNAAFYKSTAEFTKGVWELIGTEGMGHDFVSWEEFADFEAVFDTSHD